MFTKAPAAPKPELSLIDIKKEQLSELIKIQELHRKSVVVTQARIDKVSRELKELEKIPRHSHKLQRT